MDDHKAKGQELAKKAQNKLHACCPLFGSNFEDAALLFHKSATSFKLAKSWDKAGSLFVKSSKCHMKLGNKYDAANAYIGAAHCYQKTSLAGAICYLNKAVTIFEEMGRHIMAAKYSKVPFVVEYTHSPSVGTSKTWASLLLACAFPYCLPNSVDDLFHVQVHVHAEIGDLYELKQDVENARLHYERAAELFEIGDAATSVIQCKLKVAEFFAQLQQYQKAIKIYEDIARQSLNSNMLKYGVRGHLLNSGLCHVVKGDFVAISNSLERYQDLDPTFSRTREYKFLADLAASIYEGDVEKFTRVVKEFNGITPLDSWKSTLLLRVKNALNEKVMEEDDLT